MSRERALPYCQLCKHKAHEGPCKKTWSWQDSYAEEKRFFDGLRLSGGTPMGSDKTDDMRDLWMDGW